MDIDPNFRGLLNRCIISGAMSIKPKTYGYYQESLGLEGKARQGLIKMATGQGWIRVGIILDPFKKIK